LSQVIRLIDKLKLGIYLTQYFPEMADSLKELTILRNSNRDVDTTNKVGLFILVTLGISIFNLILLIIKTIGMNSLAHRPLPTMVQLVNGKTIEVTSSEGKNRSPQLIIGWLDRVLDDPTSSSLRTIGRGACHFLKRKITRTGQG
jgi:hypothetical protein